MTQAEHAHAKASPSSAKRWLSCSGSIAMEDGEPNTDSAASTEGTLAHELAAIWLSTGRIDDRLTGDMLIHITNYRDFVVSQVDQYRNAGAKVTLLIEQRLPLVDVTGESCAFGTADVVLLIEFPEHAEIHVIDLKYGYKEVDSSDPQLAIYALASRVKHNLVLNITQVHCTVMQPRVKSEPDTVTYTAKELDDIAARVWSGAQRALGILERGAVDIRELHASEDACRFCKAKYKCKEYNDFIHYTVYPELVSIKDADAEPLTPDTFIGAPADYADMLPLFMSRVPMVEMWCKAIRAKVEQELVAGRKVEGFKLVQGRSGARAFTDEELARSILAHSGVSTSLYMKPQELRTPADMEKQLKKPHPVMWAAVADLITQSPGKPSVAPALDPRPEMTAPVFDGSDYSADGLT